MSESSWFTAYCTIFNLWLCLYHYYIVLQISMYAIWKLNSSWRWRHNEMTISESDMSVYWSLLIYLLSVTEGGVNEWLKERFQTHPGYLSTVWFVGKHSNNVNKQETCVITVYNILSNDSPIIILFMNSSVYVWYLCNRVSAVSSAGVHQVSIQLDLETMFQFSHLVLTFKVKH